MSARTKAKSVPTLIPSHLSAWIAVFVNLGSTTISFSPLFRVLLNISKVSGVIMASALLAPAMMTYFAFAISACP